MSLIIVNVIGEKVSLRIEKIPIEIFRQRKKDSSTNKMIKFAQSKRYQSKCPADFAVDDV